VLEGVVVQQAAELGPEHGGLAEGFRQPVRSVFDIYLGELLGPSDREVVRVGGFFLGLCGVEGVGVFDRPGSPRSR